MSTNVDNLIARVFIEMGISRSKATKTQLNEVIEKMAYDWKQDGAEMNMMQGKIEDLEHQAANLEGLLHEAQQDNMAARDEIVTLKAEMNRLMTKEESHAGKKTNPKLPGGEDNLVLGGREVLKIMEENGWQARAGGAGYVKIYPNSLAQTADLKEIKGYLNRQGLRVRSTTSGIKTVLLVVRE